MGLADEEFVSAWCEAHRNGAGVVDLAGRLGLDYQRTYKQADRLRKAGVALPFLFGQRPRVSPKVARLNEVVKEALAR